MTPIAPTPGATEAASRPTPWHWYAVMLAVSLLAVGVRIYYVVHAQVLQPVDDQAHVHADGVEYYAYARNLAHHHTFSMAPEQGSDPKPDSFRDPGYPLFLAFWMKVFPGWDAWYAAVLLSQAVLGGLTVTLGLMMARRWMPLPWLGGAGVLMALWPHSVAINSYILSETWVGFVAMTGMAWLGSALERGRSTEAAGGSLVMGLASLSNAALTPLAPIGLAWLAVIRRIRWRTALVLLMVPLAVTLTWQVRGLSLAGTPSSAGRALTNLDQGSWPEYHAAYMGTFAHDPHAEAVLQAIARETDLMQQHPGEGVALMLHRMARAPLRYARWYASKPALLWGWNIRMGQGDVYVYPTRFSPFVDVAWLRVTAAICRSLNFWLMLAMFGSWIAIAMARKRLPASLHVTAAATVVVTLVYSALQAEPRYSIPFRNQELLLAAWAICTATHLLRRGRSRPAVMPRQDA